jgi:hypothetical protein
VGMTAGTSTLEVRQARVRGLPVVAAQVPWMHQSVAMLHVNGGYGADPSQRAGLAHLTEHVCVVTTARRHAIRVFAKTDAVCTRYLLRAAPEHAAAVAGAVGSLFTADRHDAQVHDNETSAVLTEMARLIDQPQLAVAPAAAVAGFPDLDVSVPDVATAGSVRALRAEDVVRFRAATYRPDRSVLCVLGPQDPEEMLDLLATQVPEPDALVGTEPPAAGRIPLVQPLGSACALVLALPTPMVSVEEDLASRHLAADLVTGSPGILSELAARYGTRSTAFTTMVGRDRALLVVGWPPGQHVEPLAAALEQAIGEPPLAGVDRPVAATRRRVGTTIAYEQQSGEGLATMLLRHATGTGAWPDPALFDSVPDGRLTGMAGDMLRSARLWRVAGGVLVGEEQGP